MEDTVLVVEDEADVADLLRYNLTNAGYNVLISAEGDKGLAIAREKRPDIIVLDLMLPGLTGHEVCRALKGDPNTVSIPIVMLTAKGEPHERVKGLELGADDYVTKPFSPRELVLRVQALLRRLRANSRMELVEFEGISINKTAFFSSAVGIRFPGRLSCERSGGTRHRSTPALWILTCAGFGRSSEIIPSVWKPSAGRATASVRGSALELLDRRRAAHRPRNSRAAAVSPVHPTFFRYQ